MRYVYYYDTIDGEYRSSFIKHFIYPILIFLSFFDNIDL